jgi:hypothetical protein
MRIVILSYAAVRDDIALTLMERGHDVAFFGPGLVTAAAVREFITYDGCLLLGEAAELRAFADAFAALGKAVWPALTDIPRLVPQA